MSPRAHASVSDPVRRTSVLFRVVFSVGAALSALAGIQLYVLAEDTEKYFAWTIAAPLSAAFFGAFYWGAVVIATMSFFRREWARARVGTYGVIVFFWLTLLTTLIHLEKFHLGAGEPGARVSAWIWFVVYIVVPVNGLVAFAVQARIRGTDPPVRRPFPTWQRAALGVVGVALVVLGVVMLAAPSAAAEIWPWPLTPLTSRAAGAWVVGIGVIVVTMWHDRDADRALPGSALLAFVPTLSLIALARFADDVSWGRGAAYVAALVVLLALGLLGIVAARGHGSGVRTSIGPTLHPQARIRTLHPQARIRTTSEWL